MVRNLRKWCVTMGDYKNEGFSYDDVMFGLVKLPTADVKPAWIPCSERLPEKDGNYIVTDDSGGMRCVNECLFIKCVDGSAYWSLANVIAWMPLPEPYGYMREEKKQC